MIRTRAEKQGDNYVITGRKWFITGADGAAHFILIARTSDDPRRGLTAFLFHKDQPGWRIVRRIPIMGPEEHGGHCELEFDGLEVPDENVLMSEGDGLRVTQIRLGPARLTHCMRWLGLAKRCMEIAQDYVERARRLRHQARRPRKRADQARRGRAADPDRPAAHHACRLDARPGRPRAQGSVDGQGAGRRHAAPGRRRRHPAQRRARLFQGHGRWNGSTATPRAARLVDGASEVHKMVLARFMREEGRDFWQWGSGEGEERKG